MIGFIIGGGSKVPSGLIGAGPPLIIGPHINLHSFDLRLPFICTPFRESF